jgi:serine/threonine-protein phosphatase 2A regulatory subunit B''
MILFANCKTFINFRYDNIKPEIEHQFTLKNFLDNKSYTSIFLNNILNLSKFLNHEQKDPFSMRNEIERNSEYTDWDKFAFYEYQRLTADDNEEGQETNDVFF